MPDWSHFQTQHVLNPSVDPNYSSWNRASWNDWLRKRIPGTFGSKNINSIIIATPEEIIDDFRLLQAPHTTGPDFYWSNGKYRIYYMQLVDKTNTSGSPYSVRDLGQMYFLAKISKDPNVPVHFHRQNNTQMPTGNSNIRNSDYAEIP